MNSSGAKSWDTALATCAADPQPRADGPERLRIALVGNCQVSALAEILRHVRGLSIPAVVDVNMVGSAEYVDALFALHRRADLDVVLTQPISEEFDDIATSRLRDIYRDDLLVFTNVYFSGLHPDLTYFGRRGRRVASPLGDYHSRIALIAYVKGYPIERTVSCFNDDVFHRLGYFDAYRDSLKSMVERDRCNDVRLSADFASLTERSLTMLTVNHPARVTLAHLAGMICARLDLEVPSFDQSQAVTSLDGGPIWPIYPEIHRSLKLRYAAPAAFMPAGDSGGGPLGLQDFVEGSFQLYDRQRTDPAVDAAFAEMGGRDDV